LSVDLRIASRGARLEDDAGPSSGEQVRAHPFAAPAKPGAMTGRAYIATFGVLALAGFVLIAALGLAVDAYGVFSTRLIRASHFPPQLRLAKHWDRVTKAIEIAQRQGDEVLFLGDSRFQRGIDPDSPALTGIRGYNAALVGATLAEQITVLDYSLAHEPGIKRVVWGLSLEEFPFPPFKLSDHADSAFAGRSILSGLLRHLFAYDRMISSWKALSQARHLVHAQMKRNGAVYYEGGPVEGPAVAKFFEDELKGTSRNLSGPLSPTAIETAHADLGRRLAELKAAGIDVDLVLVPPHVWRLEFFRRIGAEAQHEAWKSRIASTVESLSSAPGTGRLRLFDFARPHRLVEQSIFAPPPPGEMRYFLESSHFYPWLGDKMLARLFGEDKDAEGDSFGREIGHGAAMISIEEDIATARAALDLWESMHADEVGLIKSIVLP
jgi:hypothetical protein